MKRLLGILSVLILCAGLAWAGEVSDFSATDASNTNSSYGFTEGMAPSSVNDNMRAVEGIIARWYADWRGAIVSYGASHAIKITTNRTISALADGLLIAFEATKANTASTSLKIGSLTAKEIKKAHNVALASGDLESGMKVIVIYNADEDVFQLLTPVANADVGFADPMSTRGDIIVRNTSNATARLALGTVNKVLASDGSDVAWSATASSIGKQTIFVPAAAMKTTVSNGAASLASAETTAGRPDMIVLDFDATSDEHAQFQVAMPKGWNLSTVTFQGHWTVAAAVTPGVAIGLQCVSVSDSDTIDVAYGTAVVVTDDALNAAEDLSITAESSTVTCAGTPAAG